MGRAYKNMGGKGGKDTATRRYNISQTKLLRRGLEISDQKKRKLSADEVEIYMSQPFLYCLECGRDYKALGLHLAIAHHMSCPEYNIKHGLPENTALITWDVKEKISYGQEMAQANKPKKEKEKIKKTLEKNRKTSLKKQKQIIELSCEGCNVIFAKPLSYKYRANQKGSFIRCDECKKKITKDISAKCRNRITETKIVCFVCKKDFFGTVNQINRHNRGQNIACSKECKKLICQKALRESGKVTRDNYGAFKSLAQKKEDSHDQH